MIDTVRITYYDADQDLLDKLKEKCMLRQGVRLADMHIEYEIITGELEGSFDHRIGIKISREYKRITIMGSVHKAYIGHNVYGGIKDCKLACYLMLLKVEQITGVELPDYQDWILEQIDVSNNYLMDNQNQVKEVINRCKYWTYPKRKPVYHGGESVYFVGSTTTIKLYSKGPEFMKHDYKRLIKLVNDDKIEYIKGIACRVLRFEVSIKKRKLGMNLGQIDHNYIMGIASEEMEKMLKEKAELQIVRTLIEVQRRLYHNFTKRKANVLMGLWMQLSTIGENQVKEYMTKSTYYRNKNILISYGISWNLTDMLNTESSVNEINFFNYRILEDDYLEVA